METTAKVWIGIFRDLLLVFIGFFIIIHETLDITPPSALLLIVAAACLGLPIANRLIQLNGTKGEK